MEMFEKINLELLKVEYQNFKKSDDYKKRQKQMRFVVLANSILSMLLEREDLSNNDLSALIEMFGYGCKKENFIKYLKSIKLPADKETYIYEQYIEINEMGYTGRGRHAITGLTKDQLAEVKKLLDAVLIAKDSIQVKKAVSHYDDLGIPQVTSGIYSPWLYYLKPTICPIVTGPAADFLYALDWDKYYVTAIDLFKKMNNFVNEKDLGSFDSFLWNERWKKILINTPNKVTHRLPSVADAIALLEVKKQIILYGPPGTGKTYNTKKISGNLLENND